MRRILTALMASTMLFSSVFASFELNVNFDKSYIESGANGYNIFGENNTNKDQNVRIISVTYDGGEASDIEISDKYTVGANSRFDIPGVYNVPEDADLTGTSVRLFVWDGMDGIKPITEPYAPNGVRFEYTLTESATTSAGVYNENGELIRTLWNAVDKPVGVNYGYWDGKDDNGALMSDGNYKVIVMSNNIDYEMYTLLGNTSERINQVKMMSEYEVISDMTVYKNRMYYTNQYMENSRTWPYFNLDNCHVQAGFFERRKNKIAVRNCSDGNYVYYLSREHVPKNYIDPDAKDFADSNFNNTRAFIAALDPIAEKEVIFENGKKINNFWGAEVGHQSAVAIEYLKATDTQNEFGDIGVQKNGNNLIVIYGHTEYVRTINKITGEKKYDTALKQPGNIAIDVNDNVWISYKNEDGSQALGLFEINDIGELVLKASAPSDIILDKIIALAVSPNGNDLIVVYGGDTSKVVSYKISDWSSNWILGSGESYVDDPNVYDDKFMFYQLDAMHSTAGGVDYSFVTFEDDNTLWLGDVGNDRCFKYDLSTGKPKIIDRVHHAKVFYQCDVDANNPTRAFHNSKEYEIIYDVDNPDERWSLKRNWANQTRILTSSTMSFLDGMATLSNGKTYCAATTYRNGRYTIYEIKEKSLRDTGIGINGYTILDDGKMTLQKVEDVTYEGVAGKGYYQKYLEGIDENDNPYWSEDVMVAFIPNTNKKFYTGDHFALTESGILADVITDNSHSTTDLRDMRMGGIKAQVTADNDWLWQSCPAGSNNYTGDFPDDGALEVNAWYTWHNVFAYGRHLVAQYRGEGYRQQQANKFYHMYDNGLLLNMFGEAWNQRLPYEEYGLEMVNGNGFNWVWVKSPNYPDDVAYVLQGGEARLSGILVYKISGLTSIEEQEIPLVWSSGQRRGLSVASYPLDGIATTELVDSKVIKEAKVSGGFTDDAAHVKISGYIEKPEDCGNDVKIKVVTDGSFDMYLDNNLALSSSGTLGKTIALEDDRKTKFDVVISANNGVYNNFELYYYNEDDEEKLYPSDKLWTEPIVYEGKKTVRNLLENLPYDAKITDNKLAGWDFTNWLNLPAENGNPTILTNVRSYDSFGDYDLDFSANISKKPTLNDIVYAERTLGELRADISSWEINAEVMFTGQLNGYFKSNHSAYSGNRGRYIDVLDVNDKIIARVYPGNDYALYGNDEVVFQASVPVGYTVLSRNYTHEFTDQSPLKIYAKNGEITIAYRDGNITTTVYDDSAIWDKPAKIRVTAFEYCYYSPHGENYETDFSKLMFTQYASEETCKVTFYDENKETILKEMTVPRGTGAVAPSVERDGYILTWSDSFSCVTEDMSVYAIYTPIDMERNVTFKDENGMTLTIITGVYGDTVSYTAPKKTGWSFIGWYTELEGGEPADLTIRLTDMTVYARYEEFAKAKYDFESTDEVKMNAKTGAVTAGTYANVQGDSGFLNVEYNITYNGNVYITDANDSRTAWIRPSTRNAGDYVRFTMQPVTGDKVFKTYFSSKVNTYNDTDIKSANNGGFGMVYGTNNGSRVEVVKASCSSKNSRGIAVWNKTTSSWVTIVPTTDVEWHDIAYEIDLVSQTVKVYVDNTLKTTVPFVNAADTVNEIEFNLLNNSTQGKSSIYYIDNVGTMGV